MTARKMMGAAVVVLPLISFLFLLIVNPAAADWFARTLLARLTDPIIVLETILSAAAGAARRGLIWPLALAMATGLRFAISYSMWGAGAGDAFAEHAVHAAEYALAFAFCGYLLGRAC
ncbi:MAG TPA: hypothetical protein VKU03_13845 [Roseiarcus sp.]|nr:hypothetical protein [Roseiarcus sp.]